ncbi:MAG: hypothetical protein V1833_03930 [Elusimicrobiota bacterium]
MGMCLLNGLNNLSTMCLLMIVAIGLCFMIISVVLLFLEKAKCETVEDKDFSEKDRVPVVGLAEERIDELIAKFEIFSEDMESATQTIFNKISTKIDNLVVSSSPSPDQKQAGKIEAIISGISTKIDVVYEKLEQIESRIDSGLHKRNE